jgi:hypothetical protein
VRIEEEKIEASFKNLNACPPINPTMEGGEKVER